MSVIDAVPTTPDSGAPTRHHRPSNVRSGFVGRLVRSTGAAPAAAVLGALLVAGLLAPWVAPHDPLDQNLVNRFGGPSASHWLGTDDLGRDVLSRLIYGARIAIIAVGEGVGIALAIGVPIGLAIGMAGGWWDRVTMRVIEAIVSIPGVMVVIVVATILGTGLTNSMIALGGLFSTQFVRLCRGLVIAEREEEYVRAARVVGASPRRIVVRHLLPNISGPIIVQATLTCGAVLLAEAGLSFLGLAVQPPEPSWGTMLSSASGFIQIEPWQAIPPGAAIFVAVLAVNVLGDAIRDSLGRGRQPSGVTGALPVGFRRRLPAVSPRTTRAAGAPGPANTDVAATDVATIAGRRDDVLTISGLDIGFPTDAGRIQPVVTGLSLSIRRGEALGLVGESGSGKSLTALAALGMVPAPGVVTAGSVRVDDRQVTGATQAELTALRGTSVAMVFQDPMASMNPTQRVGRQLAEVLRVNLGLSRTDARHRVVELLDMVGIPEPAERARSFPHQFSGGMVQRIAIARALSCGPALLIADEPTTALDVTVQSEILELLRSLQHSLGMAMLFISHDLSVVAEVCDRAAVMYAGEIVEQGPVGDLLRRPRHPYTEALLGSVPHAARRGERLLTIPGTVPNPGEWAPGCRFAPRCAYSTADCAQPIALAPAGDDRFARCARIDELALVGVPDDANPDDTGPDDTGPDDTGRIDPDRDITECDDAAARR